MNRPTLSVTLTTYGPGLADPAGVAQLLEQARMAESAGVDRLLLTDHVVMGERTDLYPWGPFPFPPDTPWLEPLTLIAALSAVTTRIRFSTKILIAPLRPAPLLAKTLATLDVLSNGRMEIGVATGWQREELDASNVEWARRGRILTDTMAACRVLWRDAPGSFSSESFSFERIWCRPRPIQPDGIPIWFAGSLHARNLERIASLGDGWIPAPYSALEPFRADVVRVREAFARAGRDPSRLGIQGDLDAVAGADGRPDLRASLAAVPDWARAGATTVNVVLSLFGGPKRAEKCFAILAEEWPRQLARL
ncbi:MAG: TIGR03619 family F420-dependent LLM class oxidoreductase [Deltaproteobacteria bacterium]|nr:TIGR03619 family F420-dependent LLM class oxidoreductase [Deltaproteobacteria bacterium]